MTFETEERAVRTLAAAYLPSPCKEKAIVLLMEQPEQCVSYLTGVADAMDAVGHPMRREARHTRNLIEKELSA